MDSKISPKERDNGVTSLWARVLFVSGQRRRSKINSRHAAREITLFNPGRWTVLLPVKKYDIPFERALVILRSGSGKRHPWRADPVNYDGRDVPCRSGAGEPRRGEDCHVTDTWRARVTPHPQIPLISPVFTCLAINFAGGKNVNTCDETITISGCLLFHCNLS